MMLSLGLLGENDLRRHLTQTAGSVAQAGWRAAVLVPFVHQRDGWHLLFIRRSERSGDVHSGQVGFPGGMNEPGDAGAEECALREAHEELGLARDQVSILGMLQAQQTVGGFPVQPIAGILDWPVALTPEPSEVAHWFTVPLQWFADPAHHQAFEFQTPDGTPRSAEAFSEYRGEFVWGLTARVVFDVLDRLARSCLGR